MEKIFLCIYLMKSRIKHFCISFDVISGLHYIIDFIIS